MPEPTAPAANFWQPGFWAAGFWAELFWDEEPPPPEPPAEQPQAQPVSQPIAPRRSSSRKRVGLWVDGKPVWVDPGQVVEHPSVTKARARRKRQMAQLLRLH